MIDQQSYKIIGVDVDQRVSVTGLLRRTYKALPAVSRPSAEEI